LVNNAGVYQKDKFEDIDFSVAQYMMNVNCYSPIALIKGFIHKFLKQPQGA